MWYGHIRFKHNREISICGERICVNFIQIIASVLSTSGIITAVFWDETCVKILSALASGVSLFITAYCKQYDLGTLHKKHKEVELEWLELREDFVSILCDIRMERYT